ncbi:MAG: porin family protein [Flavitalea sp.]
MKKVLLIAVMAVTSLSLSAQSKLRSGFGIKGGVSFANINVKGSNEEFNTKTFYHAGLFSHIHVSNAFAIQPEVYYSRQGAETKGPGAREILKLGYLNVPVLFQFMVGTGFRIQAGPQLGILLNADSEVDGNEMEVDDQLKKTDFSLVGGISYMLPSGLGFDARYNYGLTDITNKDNLPAGALSDYSNRVFQVGLFYQFNTK